MVHTHSLSTVNATEHMAALPPSDLYRQNEQRKEEKEER
jgi:hypothetical protein